MRNCKDYQIPVHWMLDNGIITKVQLVSLSCLFPVFCRKMSVLRNISTRLPFKFSVALFRIIFASQSKSSAICGSQIQFSQ